ncbi:MAG: peptidoglycan-binding protein [Patescibacteria group bacterium]|nr:peptidoglycan-binding protein [Patescibacteria group bacterium]
MNKKLFVGLLAASLLLSVVVPYSSTSAQTTCNVDALRRVSFGQRGPAVGALQRCLIELGYLNIARPTNYYGSQTAAAVLQFYRDANIQAGVQARGRVFGPAGIAAMRQMLAGEMPEREEVVVRPQPEPQPQPQTGQVPPEVLNQALSLIIAGKTNEALALMAPYLGGQLPPVATPTQQTTTPPTTGPNLTPGVPGYLTAEIEPSVSGVIVREGETARAFGLRFRADSGAVRIDSIVLRWPTTNPAAPARVISRIELLDDNNNVLSSKTPADFYQDSNLNYFVPFSGLNFVVPANQFRSLFFRVSLVGTLPSVTPTWPRDVTFQVSASDVRGTDGTGAVISPSISPSPLSLTFSADATVAGSAYFVTAVDPSSPMEGYVFASDLVNGKSQDVPALVVNLTPKNDDLRLTSMTGSVVNTSIVERLRIKIGNTTVIQTTSSNGSWEVPLASYGITLKKDQAQKVTISVDLRNAAVTPATFTVSVATTTAINSVGDTKGYTTQAVSQVLGFVKGGPTFAVSSKSLVLKAKKDSSQTIVTTTVDTVSYVINVTANGTDVYIPTSAPVYVEVVKPDNSVVATTTLNVVNVVPNNTELVGSRYRVPAGNTVSFELSRVVNTDIGGNLTLRAWVKRINWGYDSTSPTVQATFMANDVNTYATSLVVPQ